VTAATARRQRDPRGRVFIAPPGVNEIDLVPSLETQRATKG
jgi:hypothetical protein